MGPEIASPLTSDSSVVIASLQKWHPLHAQSVEALRLVSWLPAHVFAEVLSSMTRMPAPFATPARETWQALRRNFGDTPVVLSAAGYLSTLEALVTCGVAGGRVYDALVAATAAEVGARLLYADVRAIPTYALVGAEAQIVRPGGEPPA